MSNIISFGLFLLVAHLFSLPVLSEIYLINTVNASELATGTNIPVTGKSDIGLFNRRASLKRMGATNYFGDTYQKGKSYDVLAGTALRGCGPVEWPAYMSSLSILPVGFPSDGPVEMFSLPPLVRYLYQFGHCFTPDQKQKLLNGFTTQKQYLTGHGTINHAIMRATSWYLLAQYFPDAIWKNMDGRDLSSAQLMAELKNLMSERMSHFYKSGQYEWLSPTYAMVNVFPLLNLIDFAADPLVRKTAEEEATLEVAILRAHSFHGVIVPPLTRKNFDQLNTTDAPLNYVPSITQQLLWYYFGEPVNLGSYDFMSKEPFYVTILGLSNWLPPKSVQNLSVAKDGDYSIKVNTPSFGIWDAETTPEIFGDGFITEDFAVGTGNLLFDPNGYSGHIQTFSILLKSDKPQNQIECYQPFWKSDLGEDAWATDRSSPFQEMYRYDKSSVVMLFDIPQKDPWIPDKDNHSFADRKMHKDALIQLAECRIPLGFDEIMTEKNWIFIHQGDVFVAMATLAGANEYNHAPQNLRSKYLIVKVREARTALFFRVERANSKMSFTQFREQVRNQIPAYDSSSSSIKLTEKSGIHTQVIYKLKAHGDGKRWSAIPEILHGGKLFFPDESYVVDSPILSLKNSVMMIHPPAQLGKQ